MPNPTELLVQITAGLVLLLFGRRVFWLVLGVIGFVFTFTILSRLELGIPNVAHLGLSVLLGLGGALLAVFLQRVALAIAGFAFGAYSTLYLLDVWSLDYGNADWLIAVLGGILVSLLASAIFDVALAMLSSLVGAGLVTSAIGLAPMPALVLLLFLTLVGLGFQLRGRTNEAGRKRRT